MYQHIYDKPKFSWSFFQHQLCPSKNDGSTRRGSRRLGSRPLEVLGAAAPMLFRSGATPGGSFFWI